MIRKILSWCSTLLFVALVGCGGDSDPVRPQPVALPPNDTPQNTVARFLAAYENEDAAAWSNLFTGDFRYHASSSVDPEITAMWPDGWPAAAESAAAANLFGGFTSTADGPIPSAMSIDVSFMPTTPQDDATSGDPVTHKVLLTTVDATIVIHPGQGDSEPTTHLITDNIHRLFLVRGDAATHLRPSQVADANHWYVYAWRDETSAYSTIVSLGAEPSTWSRVKLRYLDRETPESVMKKLVSSYEQRKLDEYERLFTTDFRFEFSNEVDPTLVERFASGWFKQDETISAGNLFQGFTDGSGTYQSPASTIDIDLANSSPSPSRTPELDPAKFYELATQVDGTFVIPAVGENLTIAFTDQVHRFLLVRGDATPALDAGQPADALHWYVYAWRDEARLFPGAYSKVGSAAAVPPTWGRMKAIYR